MKVATASKPSRSRTAILDPDDAPSEVEEVTVGSTPDEEDKTVEMVKFALTQDIDPSPTVGKISMLRDYGVPVLKKGIITIPRVVGEVLNDKGYGEIVR